MEKRKHCFLSFEGSPDRKILKTPVISSEGRYALLGNGDVICFDSDYKLFKIEVFQDQLNVFPLERIEMSFKMAEPGKGMLFFANNNKGGIYDFFNDKVLFERGFVA